MFKYFCYRVNVYRGAFNETFSSNVFSKHFAFLSGDIFAVVIVSQISLRRDQNNWFSVSMTVVQLRNPEVGYAFEGLGVHDGVTEDENVGVFVRAGPNVFVVMLTRIVQDI